MLIRRELPGDADAIRSVHADAFASDVEPRLVDDLRADPAWIPALSLVALHDGEIVGHVCCTRAHLEPSEEPVLGLGPLGVVKSRQGQGAGQALTHAVLAAADALGEPLVALLGHRDYYPRFGFVPAESLGVTAPDPSWAAHFQARPLTGYRPTLTGTFRYAPPFRAL